MIRYRDITKLSHAEKAIESAISLEISILRAYNIIYHKK